MPQNRFFFSGPLPQDTTISIRDQEFRHMVQVMRIHEKETVEVVNGEGIFATAEVTAIAKKEAHLRILTRHKEEEPQPRLILAQAIPRLNRLDFIIEKGTELGMSELWLFASEHSERRKFTSQQQERMHTIAVSALKQCGRLYLPKIQIFPSLSSISIENTEAYFGDLSENAPPFSKYLKDAPRTKNTLFFIGPERGFSSQETNWLEKQGAHGVLLHHNILRTDTAALAALTLCSSS